MSKAFWIRIEKLIPRLSVGEARALIANGTISGGMIPKIQTAIDAVEGGVNAAVIFDGRRFPMCCCWSSSPSMAPAP